MSELKRYLIQCEVIEASGSQIFYVDAGTEEEAIERFANGEGNFYADEVEVTNLSEGWVCGTTDLDDRGDQ